MNKKGRLKPMNRKYPHFTIPEIYGESLSYYELLRKLVEAMNVVIENYDTIPDQIAEAVANLDASQLFSEVLNQIIDTIATDNTKSTNAVKVYKKHDLLYATFNETVNLYESIIDFTPGTETELIIGTNIREVNISELFIELRKLIDINKNNIEAVKALANENSSEITTIHNDITAVENKNTEQDNELNTLRTMISSPYNFKGDVANISALPASGEVNDTYYVQDMKYKVTWTGSAWVQSSLSEGDYQTELNELNGDLNQYAKSDFRYIPTIENNKFCRWDTGKIQSLEGKSVSSRIPVTELESAEICSNNNVYSICFFNDETFISGSGGSSPRPKYFSIPANCNNVIISFDGLDTNIVLVYRSKIDDYIVNTQVLPTYEFSVKTVKGFMRWDNGNVYMTNDFMMTQPFIVEPSREYYVDGAVTVAACFLNGSTFVSGIALNGVDHFTIPEGCNRCVVDFNIITDLPNILVRDPLIVNDKSPCYGKALGCLGDSITQGVGNNNHSWVDKMQSMCGFKSVYNYGVSGNTIEQMHDRIDAMESALDYITLLGGTNNALWSNTQSIADFKASFDSLVRSIIEKYPTSKVLGIIPPKYNYSSGDVARNWNVATSPNNLKLIDFVNAEIEIYSKYSVPIVNLFSCCNIQPDINEQKTGLMPDGVHPNQKGYFDFIAPKIAEALKSI